MTQQYQKLDLTMEGRLINSLLQLGSGVGFYAKNKLPKTDFCLFSLKSLIKKTDNNTQSINNFINVFTLLVITKG